MKKPLLKKAVKVAPKKAKKVAVKKAKKTDHKEDYKAIVIVGTALLGVVAVLLLTK